MMSRAISSGHVQGSTWKGGSNPFEQAVRMIAPNGKPMEIPISALEDYRKYCVYTSINFGTQIGASVVVLAVMLMLMKPSKFRSPVIMLNGLAVIINIIRTILECFFFTGPWSNLYAVFTSDYSQVSQRDYAISMTVPALILLLLVTIQASLIIQVLAVCVTASQYQRLLIMALSISVAGLAVGFKLAWAVTNIRAIHQAKSSDNLEWLASCANITTTASISFFSFIFVGKLLVALHQRRRMGLRQFGPMQILIIVGFHTMTVPGKPSPDGHVLSLEKA
jgi:pheromone alpha factor receptor